MNNLISRGVRGIALTLVGLCTVTAAHAERYEKTVEVARDMAGMKSVSVSNLLGSTEVRATPGTELSVRVRIVSEDKDQQVAMSIAEAVHVEQSEVDGALELRIVPVGSDTPRIRLPRSEMDNIFSKLASPILNKSTTTVDFAGQTVEVGLGDDAVPIAVHVTVELPLDLTSSFHQSVGTLRVAAARGPTTLDVIDGTIDVDQFFGDLVVENETGPVSIHMFQGKRLEVRAREGRVDLQAVRAEELLVRTHDGKLQGETISADMAEIHTRGGNVTLAKFEPVHLKLATETGSVELATSLSGAASGSIWTGTGDVTLRLSGEPDLNLIAETKSGEVKAKRLNLEPLGWDEGKARYRLGRGGIEMEITATRGTVTLRPDDGSWFQALIKQDKR